MDANEKITHFSTYKDFLSAIRQDMDERQVVCSTRYQVRFIILNNFDVFRDLVRDLGVMDVRMLSLDDMLDDEDGWITSDQLAREIKGLGEGRHLVTPFSELVRFYDKHSFLGFMNDIILTEDVDKPSRRIYIPLIGLQNRFEAFLNNFARIEESAPVWEYLDEPQKTDVYLTEIKYDTTDFSDDINVCSLKSMREWLRFWKNQAPRKKIICSAAPLLRRSKYSMPDNIFTFKTISNAYEYVKSFLEVSIPIAYDEAEESFWKRLLDDVVKAGSKVFGFADFVLSKLNVRSLSVDKLFEFWAQPGKDDYGRWLIKNFFLNSPNTENYPYLRLCLRECSEYGTPYSLPDEIVQRIFYFSDDSTRRSHFEERNSIISASASIFRRSVTPGALDYAESRMVEINNHDRSLAISLCTGVFDFEKTLCMDWFANRGKTGFGIEKLEKLYPELAMYFSEKGLAKEDATENWHLRYLSVYRHAKLIDELTEPITAFIVKNNHNDTTFYQWYYSFEETHNLMAKHKSAESSYAIDKVCWVDALGAEFLPYILSLFEDGLNNYHVIYSEITRCTIPSATAQNRFDSQKFEDLDKIAHDNGGYKKYETLGRELDTIKTILNKITLANGGAECTIAIVSDHGLSALSRHADSRKYDDKVEHDGRYIKLEEGEEAHHNADYVVHKNEHDGSRYKVALTHSSLGRKPVHEVHGGCTPEEILVPYIIISNKEKKIKNYTYTIVTKEVEQTRPEIIVNIIPQPEQAILSIGGKDYPMARNGSNWSAFAAGLSEGKHKFDITASGGNTYKDIITVTGTGIGSNDFLSDF